MIILIKYINHLYCFIVPKYWIELNFSFGGIKPQAKGALSPSSKVSFFSFLGKLKSRMLFDLLTNSTHKEIGKSKCILAWAIITKPLYCFHFLWRAVKSNTDHVVPLVAQVTGNPVSPSRFVAMIARSVIFIWGVITRDWHLQGASWPRTGWARVRWDTWPSQIKTLVLLLKCSVDFRKMFLNQSTKIGPSIQPLSLVLYRAPCGPSCIHSWYRFFPLYMT